MTMATGDDKQEPMPNVIVGDLTPEQEARVEDPGKPRAEEAKAEALDGARKSVKERLAELAEKAEAEPTFTSDKRVDPDDAASRVNLPGRADEWFVPRALTRMEVLAYQKVRSKSSMWMTVADVGKRDVPRKFDVDPNLDEAFLLLACLGIERYRFWRRKSKEYVEGGYQTNPASAGRKKMEEDLRALAPAVGEWLDLWLQDYNGLTEEEAVAEGNA